ncbi:MAG: M23 family metallopeptidase [Methylophilaceae bacterium]
MQIFWVSSAVGQFKSVNITFKKLIAIFCGLVLTLIFLGVALQFFGFRMAIEYDPTIARKLGNLHTAVELENLHALYRLKLNELNQQLESNRQKIYQLLQLNKRLSEIATPAMLRKESDRFSLEGSYPELLALNQTSTLKALSITAKQMRRLNKVSEQDIDQLSRYIAWLESKPIKAPLHGEILMASGFGKRTDPMSAMPSFHPGIDLSAPIGTPFYAAASGKITQISSNPEYGTQLILEHADGFTTRYAHLQSVAVKQGSLIQQGDYLGTTGNTGKSTGPHLHFETMRNGDKIDPLKLLLITQK